MKASLKNEHDQIKNLTKDDIIKKIEAMPDPFSAVDYLVTHALVGNICAIIDKMSPIGGTFIFAVIKIRAQTTHMEARQIKLYRNIIERIENLELDVLKGFQYARDETYRLIGKVHVIL